MPGAGTRTAITPSNPPARLLDVTRLVSRIGRGPATGIDRVELAYLRYLSRTPEPLFMLVRTPLGFLLLPDGAADDVLRRLEGGTAWGGLDAIGWFPSGQPKTLRQAYAFLRRAAIGRCAAAGLEKMLRENLPEGVSMLNVGHSNLSEWSLQAIRNLPRSKITVMLHDAIPLDYPQFSGAGIPERFAAKLLAVARHADQVIYTTCAAQQDLSRHLPRQPDPVIAPLGIEPFQIGSLTPDERPTRPYFVALGTLEPRKNLSLLLDVWERLGAGPKVPALLMIGRRGWRSDNLFDRLDKLKARGVPLAEHPNLPDEKVAALLADAQALLFPTLAEGFGLPPFEAASIGVPVIASDLPVLRENLGDFPVYLSPRDPYSWQTMIEAWAEQRPDFRPPPDIPRWDDHFRVVLDKV